jgi:hypothetical protein
MSIAVIEIEAGSIATLLAEEGRACKGGSWGRQSCSLTITKICIRLYKYLMLHSSGEWMVRNRLSCGCDENQSFSAGF